MRENTCITYSHELFQIVSLHYYHNPKQIHKAAANYGGIYTHRQLRHIQVTSQ